jgi:hypothetical protein
MTTFDATALAAAVIILLALAACVLIGIIAGTVRMAVRSWRHASNIIAETEAEARDGLRGLTGCTWCQDTGQNALPEDCTCRQKCEGIGWCRSEWTTALITPGKEHQ